MVPFADLRSGGQVKYTGNFGTCTNLPCDQTLPAPSDPFVITKVASPTSLPNGGTATYTVTIANTSDFGQQPRCDSGHAARGRDLPGIRAG
jgi:hypothetical protein